MRKILKDVLRGHQEQEKSWALWETLSPREKDITALICQDYTTRQIAARLHISPETVKTYAEKLLLKFDLHSRNELRRLLKDWDFSEWDR